MNKKHLIYVSSKTFAAIMVLIICIAYFSKVTSLVAGDIKKQKSLKSQLNNELIFKKSLESEYELAKPHLEELKSKFATKSNPEEVTAYLESLINDSVAVKSVKVSNNNAAQDKIPVEIQIMGSLKEIEECVKKIDQNKYYSLITNTDISKPAVAGDNSSYIANIKLEFYTRD